MAQTGFTPIQLYSSSTTGNAPSAGNLLNNSTGSELAINITDGKLFYKDNGGSVQVIGWKTTPTTAGGTGLTSYTAGDMLYYASGTVLSKLAIGSSGQYLSSSGTAPQWSAPAALTKTNDTNVTLTLGGSASTALLNAASLTLGWTGTLAATRGGTGLGSYAVGDILYADTTTSLAKLADVATGNALISGGVGVAPSWGKIGLTTHVLGTLPIANGGTNLTSFTSGGLLYASSTSALASATGVLSTGTSLGIGISPSYLLDIYSATAGQWTHFKGTNTSEFSEMWFGTDSSDSPNIVYQAFNNSTGGMYYYLRFGGTTSFYNCIAFDSGGNAYKSSGAGSWLALSDSKIKTNVQPVVGGLSRILQLKPVTFDYKQPSAHKDKVTDKGFIADEFMQIYPDSVIETEFIASDDRQYFAPGEKAKSMGYNAEFYADLVSAIQELKAEFDAYKSTHG